MGDFWKVTNLAKDRAAGRCEATRNEDAGLEKRMHGEMRRLSSQHHQLDTFFDMLMEALGRGSLHGARIAFTRFRDALEAHITLEDEVFFPALRGLAPVLSDELAVLVRDHIEIRRQLDGLHDRLAEGSAEIFAADLDRMASQLADHESREERLLARVSGKAQSEEPRLG